MWHPLVAHLEAVSMVGVGRKAPVIEDASSGEVKPAGGTSGRVGGGHTARA